ncbi:hypothetical protein PBY51_012446 [Eleginops maclovinus]|uniref:Uncharacterized protein n=1 Tax=Eleginops maclovinus TaxID=56733 RepID=A0AAN8AUS0_ELEMC|nr:hypothetical protein PBY51_012446 [Eleginops maclovinus]
MELVPGVGQVMVEEVALRPDHSRASCSSLSPQRDISFSFCLPHHSATPSPLSDNPPFNPCALSCTLREANTIDELPACQRAASLLRHAWS